jgi:hypothetical protein
VAEKHAVLQRECLRIRAASFERVQQEVDKRLFSGGSPLFAATPLRAEDVSMPSSGEWRVRINEQTSDRDSGDDDWIRWRRR